MRDVTPFKIMRPESVKRREDPGDTRLYYCDPDVDVVVTTMTKKHRGPEHLHTENVESYFVVRGELTMHVGEHCEVLHEGDMMVVYPGACHCFETTDEEVCFLAIKKYPQLQDKEPCS